MKYLVESCLLTHGLRSVSDDEVRNAWKDLDSYFAWIENGEIKTGKMDEFICFRAKRVKLRINCMNLDEKIKEKATGALTASGTMEVCHRLGIPATVTCGIGGIGNVPGEKLCPDLPALEHIPVTLIATSPKDMIDIPSTFDWLRKRGVTILGYQSEYCTGYVFESANEKLDGSFYGKTIPQGGKTLLLNPIPTEQRIKDIRILQEAVKEANDAVCRGEYFHPAANGAIDRLTDGKSSYIQLESIVQNAGLAEKYINDKK